jgi:lambda repressor-like predicted transcriptional regulator
MESEQIKSLIRKRGHTYKSLGEEIGITPQAVGDVVAGKTRGATARYAVAAALHVRVEDIWPDEAPAGSPAAA